MCHIAGVIHCYDGIAVAGKGTGASLSTTGLPKSFYAEVHSPNSARHPQLSHRPLNDAVPPDEIVYRLFVLSKVQQGVKDIDAGRTVSTDELAREIENLQGTTQPALPSPS